MENKEEKPEDKNVILLFDMFLQVQALQKLLISKGVMTIEELQNATNKETAEMLKPFLLKLGIEQDKVEETIQTLVNNRK